MEASEVLLLQSCSQAVSRLSALKSSFAVGSSGGGSGNTAVHVRCSTEVYEEENAVAACTRGEALRSCNATLGKLLGSLGHACAQAAEVEAEARETVYPLLLMTGESPPGEVEEEGQAQARLAPGVGALLRAVRVADAAADIAVHALSQLAALADDGQRLYATLQRDSVHMQSVMRAAGTALSVIAKMDMVATSNPGVAKNVSLFRSMLDAMEEDGTTSGDEVEELHVAIDRIESRFASESPLLLRVLRDRLSSGSSFRANPRLLKAIRSGVSEMLSQVVTRIGGADERLGDRDELLTLTLLVIAHYWIAVGEPADVRLTKALFESFRVAPVVCAFNEVGICLADLLQTHLPPWSAETLPRDAEQLGAAYLEESIGLIDARFVEEMTQIKVGVDCWCLSFESVMSGKMVLNDDHVLKVLTLLVQGVHMASRTKTLMLDLSTMHLRMTRPLSLALVRSLGRGLEMLKGIDGVFEKYGVLLAAGTLHQISRLVQKMIFDIVIPARSGLEARLSGAATSSRSSSSSSSSGRRKSTIKANDDAALDAFAAATLMLHILQGPPSSTRMHIIDVIFDVLRDTGFFSEEESTALDAKKYLLYVVTNAQDLVSRLCDTSFVYFTRDSLLPALLSELFTNTERSPKLRYLVSAFRDVENLIVKGPGAMPVLLRSYTDELDERIHECILKPLCENVETDLRLHLHSAKLEGAVLSNPTRTGVRAINKLLALPTLRLRNRLLNVKYHVTQYLNETFYNLTALALHNWRTYGEMAELARQKYDIVLEKMLLPNQQLEQGLDVLEVMRNIHIFAAKFNYNLNMQVFVEKASQSQQRKHLNTVSLRHVTNSIRTHGMGITDTTVKFVYQYLSKKFVIFSQFLYDDHIKSRLRRELKMFSILKREQKVAAEYPFTSAENFKKDIRKLGVTENGGSYLDQFRRLITEIGNALGFVRMVGLGAATFSHSAVRFMSTGATLGGERGAVTDERDRSTTIPAKNERNDGAGTSTGGGSVVENNGADVGEGGVSHEINDSINTIASIAGAEYLSDDVVSAAKLLDDVQDRMQSSLNRAEYFKILVEVFSKGLNQDRNLHLNDFYIIVPALCASHVDALLLAKEKLTKRGKDSLQAGFTEDGFAIGVAYVLKVLNQVADFDALHWFDAVRRHFDMEIKRLSNQSSSSPASSLSPTMLSSTTTSPNGGVSTDGTPSPTMLSSISRRRATTTTASQFTLGVMQQQQQQRQQLSEEEVQNIQLLQARARSYAREYELLEFSISSSRTFFVSE